MTASGSISSTMLVKIVAVACVLMAVEINQVAGVRVRDLDDHYTMSENEQWNALLGEDGNHVQEDLV